LMSQSRVADAKNQYLSDTSIGPNPMEYGGDIVTAYAKPLAQQAAIKDLNKAYTDNVTRVTFLSRNTPTDRRENIPDVAKKAWQKEVTNTATNALVSGDYTTFIQAVVNNPGYGLEVGDTLFQRFNQSESQVELDTIVDSMMVINNQDRGGTALRQSLTEDKYLEIMAVQGISSVLYPNDIAKGREYYNKSKDTYNPMSKDLKNTMSDHQTKLGRQYASYYRTMIALNNIDPKVAKVQEGKVREFFLSQSKDYGGMFKDKMKVDTSMGEDPFEKLSLLPREDAKAVLEYIGEGDRDVISLPNGTIQVVDEFGGNSQAINIDKYIEVKNKQVEKIKKITGNPIPVVDVITSKAADKLNSIVAESVDVYDTVSQAVGSSFPGMVNRFRSLFTARTYEESLQKLKEVKALHSTPDTVEVDNDTRDDVTKAQYNYNQYINKKVLQKVDTLITTISQERVLNLPKDTQELLLNAISISQDDFISIGSKDETGLVTTPGYITDKHNNMLPEGYVRKRNKIYKIE
ncbi:MAG: hypothetical protein DRP62_08825, partial [Planctomycetota bacterium]